MTCGRYQLSTGPLSERELRAVYRRGLGTVACVVFVVLAFFAAVALSSCAHAPCPAPPPPVTILAQCPDLGPEPARARFATTRAGCPAGLTCYAPGDITVLLDELQARRDFDARAGACLRPARHAPTTTAAPLVPQSRHAPAQ